MKVRLSGLRPGTEDVHRKEVRNVRGEDRPRRGPQQVPGRRHGEYAAKSSPRTWILPHSVRRHTLGQVCGARGQNMKRLIERIRYKIEEVEKERFENAREYTFRHISLFRSFCKRLRVARFRELENT